MPNSAIPLIWRRIKKIWGFMITFGFGIFFEKKIGFFYLILAKFISWLRPRESK